MPAAGRPGMAEDILDKKQGARNENDDWAAGRRYSGGCRDVVHCADIERAKSGGRYHCAVSQKCRRICVRQPEAGAFAEMVSAVAGADAAGALQTIRQISS